ncbi:hypothetical protein [Ruegeria hyattellae]|uniref:hypothetical protein n=1 Tax=Ruegeria hyattellae TaxID=3233337 RepID=UPI00355B0D9E
MMHANRADELLKAVVALGVDIRPSALGVTWGDVFDAMRGLRKFVYREYLAYGIANDFVVTELFLTKARDKIEEAFSV